MTQPYAKGTIESIGISPKHKDSYKATLVQVVVAGKEVQIMDYDSNLLTDFNVGDAVAVWENTKGKFKSYKMTKDTYQGGGSATAAPKATKSSYTPRTDQQASIVAQNALNRGMDAVRINTMAVEAALKEGVSGVTKAQLKLLTDPDYVMEQAVHQANRVHALLMAGDLSQELPKFEKEPESE